MVSEYTGPAMLIIPDGNRRAAARHGWTLANSYLEMARRIAQTVDCLAAQGIDRVYFAVNSVENLERPADEVRAAFPAFWEVPGFANTRLRVTLSGNIGLLPPEYKDGFTDLLDRTAGNTDFNLAYMLNWSITDEIARLCRLAQGMSRPPTVEQLMAVSDIREPIDLIIRTGGRQRLSNFIPWHSPYAEVRILDVLWPDFTNAHLLGCIASLKNSVRTYGH